MNKPNQFVGAAVLAMAAFFTLGLFWIESQAGYAGISNRTVPVLVAIGLGICGLLIMLRGDAVLLEAEDADGQPPKIMQLGWVLAGLVLTIVLIGWVGFPLASVVLMVCVARGYGSVRPLRDALISLAITLPLWFLFAKLLAINLPLLPALGI
jgi:putative tricarboxylic transport membrane protein